MFLFWYRFIQVIAPNVCRERLSQLKGFWDWKLPYNPVSFRSRIILGRQVLLPEENISFNSRRV